MGQTMSLRERHKLQTRDHLLETAGNLFAEKGFVGTSIDDIVSAAGMSRATVYAYFDSKDALLTAVVERMWLEAQQHWEDFASLADWSRGSILSWLKDFAAAWQRDALRNRAAAAASAAGILVESYDRQRGFVVAVRRNRELWREFPETEGDLRASMVVHVVQAEFTDYFFHGSSLDLDVFVGYLTDAVRALLVRA